MTSTKQMSSDWRNYVQDKVLSCIGVELWQLEETDCFTGTNRSGRKLWSVVVAGTFGKQRTLTFRLNGSEQNIRQASVLAANCFLAEIKKAADEKAHFDLLNINIEHTVEHRHRRENATFDFNYNMSVLSFNWFTKDKEQIVPHILLLMDHLCGEEHEETRKTMEYLS